MAIAREPLSFIRKIRPRHVDPEAFKDEEEQWGNWHEIQKQAENQQKIRLDLNEADRAAHGMPSWRSAENRSG